MEAYRHKYPYTFRPQGSPVVDEGWSGSWPPASRPAYPQNPQVCGEAYQGFPFTTDPMYQKMFPWFTPGSDFRAASDEDRALADVDSTPNLSVSSTTPRTSSTPTIVQYPAQNPSRYRSPGFKNLKKHPTAAPSSSSRRRAGIRGAPERPYQCNICRKVYAQSQGVTRHHREAHQASKCMYCDFKWGRRYQFRKHLEERHPDVDSDSILGRPTGSYLKVTKHSPQRQVSPPTTEHDRWSRAEAPMCPLVPHPSAVAEVTPLPVPVMSSSGYDQQPELAETINTTQTNEYTRELESLVAAYAYAAASAMEEHAPRANDFDIASQSGQNWYQNKGHSAYQGGSTAASSQSNPYHTLHPYRLVADMTPQSSSLWLNRVDPHVLGHYLAQAQNTMRSGLPPRGGLPRRH